MIPFLKIKRFGRNKSPEFRCRMRGHYLPLSSRIAKLQYYLNPTKAMVLRLLEINNICLF